MKFQRVFCVNNSTNFPKHQMEGFPSCFCNIKCHKFILHERNQINFILITLRNLMALYLQQPHLQDNRWGGYNILPFFWHFTLEDIFTSGKNIKHYNYMLNITCNICFNVWNLCICFNHIQNKLEQGRNVCSYAGQWGYVGLQQLEQLKSWASTTL